MQGRVAAIQVCPGHREPMRGVSVAELDAGMGLRGDTHAKPASKRQVLLADKEALDALGLLAGTIKENITVEGVDVMRLSPGTRLRLGAAAMLEVTTVCEPCFRMDEIRAGLRAELEGRRGMNTVVIEGGRVAVGDRVTVFEPGPLSP